MSNSTGLLFRVTTFGESHGPALGAIVDGCPPAIPLDTAGIQADLDRRRPAQGRLGSRRREPDRVEILSGVFEGLTTGTPIALLIRNEDAEPAAYDALRDLYRPGHADFTYEARYGVRDHRGGGRASARETAARVAAGAVARAFLAHVGASPGAGLAGAPEPGGRPLAEVPEPGGRPTTGAPEPGVRPSGPQAIEVLAWVDAVGEIAAEVDPSTVTRAAIEATEVRCPDPGAAARMAEHIAAVRKAGDTIGGVVRCVARHVPAGLGAPVFDKLGADLAHACLSIPACKGFEIGSGFAGTRMRGTEHNDPFYLDEATDRVRTLKNDAGGVLGGISSGEDVLIRCAFKPVPTHFQPQTTITRAGTRADLRITGRHDTCVVPRAAPIVEAAMLLVLADHMLRRRAVR